MKKRTGLHHRQSAMAVVVIFVAARCFADFVAVFYNPPRKLPKPDEIIAFANDSPSGRHKLLPPNMRIQKADLLLFLSQGFVITNFPPSQDYICTGVIFTQNGHGVWWELINDSVLDLTPCGKNFCSLSIEHPCKPKALEPSEKKPLMVPRADDVVGFENGVWRHNGISNPQRIYLEKSQVINFLKNGKVHSYPGKWWAARFEGSITLPEQIKRRLSIYGDHPGSLRKYLDYGANGAFATKDGKVFFWELWADNRLFLEDEDGATCLLALP